MYSILCVEDEADFREDIADFLRMKSLEVTEAANGKQALGILRERAFDLILCDVMMPDMDGKGLLRAVRRLEGEKQLTPFVFLSALSDKQTMLQGRQWGCDEYLTKPIDFDLLLATIEGRIERQHASDYVREAMRHGLNSRLEHFINEEMYMPLAELAHSCTQLCDALPDDAGIALVDKAGRMRQRTQLHAMRARKLSELMQHMPLVAGPSHHRADDCAMFATQIALRVFGAEARHQLHIETSGMMPILPIREVTLGVSMLLESAHKRGREHEQGLALKRQGGVLVVEIADRSEDLKDERYAYVAWGDSTDIGALQQAVQGRILPIMYAERLAKALEGGMGIKIVDTHYAVLRLVLPEMAAAEIMHRLPEKILAIENHYH